MRCNQSRPGFELVSPCPIPTTITITPRARQDDDDDDNNNNNNDDYQTLSTSFFFFGSSEKHIYYLNLQSGMFIPESVKTTNRTNRSNDIM